MIVIDNFRNILLLIDEMFSVINEISIECENDHKKNIYLAAFFLEFKKKSMDRFMENGVCPPIFYFIDQIKGMSTDDAINFLTNEDDLIDIDKIIFSSYIKKHYCTAMDQWGEHESYDHIKEFISNIKDNFERDNIFSATLNLFTLIEFKVREVYGCNISTGEITKTIKNVLKEQCFKYKKVPSEGLEKIYNEFLEGGRFNLYKSTQNKPQYITRHMLHGDRLDLIDKKRMISLVFFTDCIYKMLFKFEN
ncbi:hypothetical protein [Clostridium sp. LY3-2]|uniref:hypothetical protein n=1 Tax=Clostridium sp. LY3-2 TaxID=2942482 RepID=UPI00215376BC|nr:hypothetical protein [Clostridium sp. LY3-2]